MKKIIYLLLAAFISLKGLQGQTITDSLLRIRISDRDLGSQYLQKCHNEILIGTVILGVGTVAFIGGANGISQNIFRNASSYEILFFAGAATMISSIPVFIHASKCKRRAEVLLRSENVPLSRMVPIPSNMLSFGIAFNFR